MTKHPIQEPKQQPRADEKQGGKPMPGAVII